METEVTKKTCQSNKLIVRPVYHFLSICLISYLFFGVFYDRYSTNDRVSYKTKGTILEIEKADMYGYRIKVRLQSDSIIQDAQRATNYQIHHLGDSVPVVVMQGKDELYFYEPEEIGYFYMFYFITLASSTLFFEVFYFIYRKIKYDDRL